MTIAAVQMTKAIMMITSVSMSNSDSSGLQRTKGNLSDLFQGDELSLLPKAKVLVIA